ncbi:MAG: 2-hydroxyacid dehydrogenase [Gammaproteobacteria bacterium]|nr:2-hydroxyacid dehydrogenase [Gammaproteobacteria bacterium]
MTDPNSVFLDLSTIDRGDLELARLRRVSPHWEIFDRTAPELTLERIKGAHIVVTNKVVLERRILAGAPNLKLICIAATGTNNVDLEAAREMGIHVTNVVRYATPAVVQHVFGLILALTTRLSDYRESVIQGAWQRSDQFCLLDFPIRELSGRTLGIVGYGELGQAVGRVAEAFGMVLLVAQRPGGPTRPGRSPLCELLPRADIVTLHCPLTETTRNLICYDELTLMKPDALLINTARGGIVDEQALADTLRQGGIGGAGLDVLGVEPPSEGNPLLQPGIPNLIVTPHIAWASRESRQRLIDEVALSIEAFWEGREWNRVV